MNVPLQLALWVLSVILLFGLFDYLRPEALILRRTEEVCCNVGVELFAHFQGALDCDIVSVHIEVWWTESDLVEQAVEIVHAQKELGRPVSFHY